MELGWGLFWVTFTFCMCVSVAVCPCLLFYVRCYLYHSTNNVSVFFKIPFYSLETPSLKYQSCFCCVPEVVLCVFLCVLLRWGLGSPHWCIFLYPASDKYLFIILRLENFEWAIAGGSEKTSGEVDCSFPDSALLALVCSVNRAYLLTLSLVSYSLVMPQWFCCWFQWCLS